MTLSMLAGQRDRAEPGRGGSPPVRWSRASGRRAARSAARPPRAASSMTTDTAVTTPPACSTSAMVAAERAAGGQHVVDDQHPLTGPDRVGVQLERRRAVLQRVVGGEPLPRQLAGLAHRHDADAGVVGHRGGQQEAAGLHADDDVEARVTGRRPPDSATAAARGSDADGRGEPVDHAPEGRRRRRRPASGPGRATPGSGKSGTSTARLGDQLVERQLRSSLTSPAALARPGSARAAAGRAPGRGVDVPPAAGLAPDRRRRLDDDVGRHLAGQVALGDRDRRRRRGRAARRALATGPAGTAAPRLAGRGRAARQDALRSVMLVRLTLLQVARSGVPRKNEE